MFNSEPIKPCCFAFFQAIYTFINILDRHSNLRIDMVIRISRKKSSQSSACLVALLGTHTDWKIEANLSAISLSSWKPSITLAGWVLLLNLDLHVLQKLSISLLNSASFKLSENSFPLQPRQEWHYNSPPVTLQRCGQVSTQTPRWASTNMSEATQMVKASRTDTGDMLWRLRLAEMTTAFI